MNINSTVISGYQALNDMRYLLKGISTAVVVTDRNIEAIPAVQALMGQLRDQIPGISVVNSVRLNQASMMWQRLSRRSPGPRSIW